MSVLCLSGSVGKPSTILFTALSLSAAMRPLELSAYREPGCSGCEGGDGGGEGGEGGEGGGGGDGGGGDGDGGNDGGGEGGEGGEGGGGDEDGGGCGAAPQLTATCAIASPLQPPPRVYSKANNAEYTPTLTACHASPWSVASPPRLHSSSPAALVRQSSPTSDPRMW